MIIGSLIYTMCIHFFFFYVELEKTLENLTSVKEDDKNLEIEENKVEISNNEESSKK